MLGATASDDCGKRFDHCGPVLQRPVREIEIEREREREGAVPLVTSAGQKLLMPLHDVTEHLSKNHQDRFITLAVALM